MTVSKKQLIAPKPNPPNICVAHPMTEIVFFSTSRFTTVFGMMTKVLQSSEKDRAKRKKYMGVWRLQVTVIAVMMLMFEIRITIYARKKIGKSSSWSFFRLENPSRKNSGTVLSFPLFIMLVKGRKEVKDLGLY